MAKESQGTLSQKAIYKAEPVALLNTATRRVWVVVGWWAKGRKSREQCNDMYEFRLYTLRTTSRGTGKTQEI